MPEPKTITTQGSVAAEWLHDAVELGLSPLVEPDALSRMASLADALRMDAQAVCMECRLGGHDSRVDLALCLFRSETARRGFEEAAEAMRARDREDIARPMDFLRKWSEGTVQVQIPFVWCAFDLDESTGIPAPCLSLCVDRAYFVRKIGRSDKLWLDAYPPTELRRITESIYQEIVGDAIPVTIAARLEACAETLLGLGYCKHVSFMLSRSPISVKLDVCLPAANAIAYLTAIGWKGSLFDLEVALRTWMPWNGQLQLNLNLNAGFEGPIEVEFLTLPREADLRQRGAFLNGLVAMGLCDQAKANILRDVIDYPVQRSPKTGKSYARAWYAKLSLDGGKCVQAKAYFSFQKRPG